jgi:hypothetical protein
MYVARQMREDRPTASRTPLSWLADPESEGRPMIHPSDPEIRRSVAVRDGHGAPVTCAACGCRLRSGMADNDIAWFHFNPIAGRDARGCRVDCVDAAHDVAGYRAVSLALA